MKIEKLNENQIRATLSKEDLESRHLKLSEFAYGTDAARSLFAELLRFASYKLGFEVDDTPLMIEAIPISSDSIVLIITKIAYPDELDTRFSRFSDAPNTEDIADYYEQADYESREVFLDDNIVKASDIIDVSAMDVTDTDSSPKVIPPGKYTRLFGLDTIDDVFTLANVFKDRYTGDNTLFHTKDGYRLILSIGDLSIAEFNRVVNITSEYANSLPYREGTDDYMFEHQKPLIRDRALEILSRL